MGYFAHEWLHHEKHMRGFTPMFIAAAVSVAALLAVIGWQIDRSTQGINATASEPPTTARTPVSPIVGATPASSPYALISANEAASSDTFSQLGTAVLDRLINAYTGLQSAGIFSTSTAQAAAHDTLPLLTTKVTYDVYTSDEIKTDRDTSYARMLTYRSDLRASLAPLLKSTTPEYEIFGNYLKTNDTAYLTALGDVAQNYRDAIAATAKVVVPADAVPYHVAILNAMQEFAAMLDALKANADDPFTSVALLRTYDQAESDMVTSFNALTTYYKSK